MNTFIKAAEILTEQSNQGVGHAIDTLGKGSLVVGGGAKGVELIQPGLGLPDWAAIVAIIGGLFYIVKLSLEMVIYYRKIKED